MFAKSARYYDALYQVKDYAAAAEELRRLIQERHPSAGTLLDVGCGSGRHLEWFGRHVRVEGLDLNAELLRLAAERCPEVPLHQADMVDFDLGHRVDVVTCLFSSIGYVKTPDRMRRAVATMARHLNRGGLMLIEPWFTPDTYWTGTITSNYVNLPDLRIAWMYTSEREGDVAVLNIHYLVGTRERVEHFTEVHEFGLFSHEEYLAALRDAGLSGSHLANGFFGRGMYVGKAAA